MDRRDEDIILEYQDGNDHVMEELFERYKSRVLNFSLRILGNRADAEDVTGDVFLTLFDKKYSFDPKVKFSTWLFTVARNKCIDKIRKNKRSVSMWFSNKSNKSEQWEFEDHDAKTEKKVIENEQAIEVKKAIARLKFEQKEAIVLREYNRLSYEEISHILGCSLDKVKILIFRAREALRADLASFIKEGQ